MLLEVWLYCEKKLDDYAKQNNWLAIKLQLALMAYHLWMFTV